MIKFVNIIFEQQLCNICPLVDLSFGIQRGLQQPLGVFGEARVGLDEEFYLMPLHS